MQSYTDHIHRIYPSTFDNLPDEIRSIAIARVTVLRRVQDEHICLFADFDGADHIGPSDCVRRIDRCRRYCLGGSYFHCATGERDDKLH